jgi:hypothetical protein
VNPGKCGKIVCNSARTEAYQNVQPTGSRLLESLIAVGVGLFHRTDSDTVQQNEV